MKSYYSFLFGRGHKERRGRVDPNDSYFRAETRSGKRVDRYRSKTKRFEKSVEHGNDERISRRKE